MGPIGGHAAHETHGTCGARVATRELWGLWGTHGTHGQVGTHEVHGTPLGRTVSGQFHEETDAADARAHSQRSTP